MIKYSEECTSTINGEKTINSYNTAVEVFKYFLQRIREVELPLILLRPREISEDISYSGDYDFFIAPKHVNPLLQVMYQVAVETRSTFTVSRLQHGKIELSLYSRADNQYISLEIWNILSVKDPYKKTLRYIFPQNLENIFVKQSDNSFNLPLEVESLYYLSHLYTGKKKLTTPLVEERILYYFQELKKVESKYFSLYQSLLDGSNDIKEVAHKANMELVARGLLGISDNIKAYFLESLIKASSTFNRVKRWIFLCAHMIPVIGPDGVGKTSLIERTRQKSEPQIDFFRFKKTFRISPIYKLFFPILGKIVQIEAHQKEKPSKTQVDDRFGNFVIFNAFLLFPLRLIKYVFSKKMVFIDRYFHEYLLINARWESEKVRLRSDWKFLLKFIPRTFSIIHLDAPTEVILLRKNELTENGIEAYRQSLYQVFLEKPFLVYTYINTDMPLEQCSDLVLAISLRKK